MHPQTTKVVDHHITNCTTCMYTCHDPCYIAGDEKQGCAAMQGGENCVACPGNCPYTTHKNGDRIYIYDSVEEEETIQDMADKYNIALGDRDAKAELLYKLMEDYTSLKSKVFNNIMSACETSKELEAIALGKSLLTSVDYIKRLIQSEEKGNRPNKEDRLGQLQHFLERAELLAAVRGDSSNLTTHMSDYEKTVYTMQSRTWRRTWMKRTNRGRKWPVGEKDMSKQGKAII